MRTTTTGRNVRDGRSGRGGTGRENKKQNTSKHGRHVKNRKNIKIRDGGGNSESDPESTASDEETSDTTPPPYQCPEFRKLIWGRGRACNSPPRALIREFADRRYYGRKDCEVWCDKCDQCACRIEELSGECRKSLGALFGPWADYDWVPWK
jgi:hypothetical protein